MAEQRVQRRLAAILAADVVGYSRLMGVDEAGTLARLKNLRAEFLHPKVLDSTLRCVNRCHNLVACEARAGSPPS